MLKIWKKETEDLFSSPQETMGFSRELGIEQAQSINAMFLIKKFAFSSINQIDDIKRELGRKRILIINAKSLFEANNTQIETVKKCIEEIKTFLKENGGSIGRIGDDFLIITPNSQIKIAS